LLMTVAVAFTIRKVSRRWTKSMSELSVVWNFPLLICAIVSSTYFFFDCIHIYFFQGCGWRHRQKHITRCHYGTDYISITSKP
jgi:hypothetical protein